MFGYPKSKLNIKDPLSTVSCLEYNLSFRIFFLRSITGRGQTNKQKKKPKKMGNQKTKKFANPKKKGTNLKKIESKRRISRSIDNSAMQVWQTNWEKFTQKKKSSATSTAQTKKSRKTFFKKQFK